MSRMTERQILKMSSMEFEIRNALGNMGFSADDISAAIKKTGGKSVEAAMSVLLKDERNSQRSSKKQKTEAKQTPPKKSPKKSSNEKRSKKKSSKPQRSAYEVFFLQKKEELMQEMKEITFGDLKNRIDKAWNGLSQEERLQWKEEEEKPDSDHDEANFEKAHNEDDQNMASPAEQGGQDDQESGGIMEFDEVAASTSTEPPKQLDIGDQERTLTGGELDDQESDKNQERLHTPVKLEVTTQSNVSNENNEKSKNLSEEPNTANETYELEGYDEETSAGKKSSKRPKSQERIIFGSARQMAIAAAKEEMQQEMEKKLKEQVQQEETKKKPVASSKIKTENSTRDPARKVESSSTSSTIPRIKALDSHDVDPAWMGFVYDEGLDSNLQGPDCFAESTTLQLKSAVASERIEKDETLESSEERKLKPRLRGMYLSDIINKILIRDWQQVVTNKKLYKLPREKSLREILTLFSSCASKDDIDRRNKFAQRDQENSHPCDVYGGEHLARLLAKLPEFLTNTEMDKSKASEIVEQFRELVTFIEKNVSAIIEGGEAILRIF
ncbi:hypothetical protein GUITHDRAFT_105335 [Guillardia theta CCMP2712]|uniref:HMG box domain-containing protein n=1 Tax=Guillardia theta (strain CCMP2712) TaxID=905079 RepID=L1JKP2_GUITC|nr:hypothetical protein GUITHDRAFT_105335 [Guillardia theta CCMP2712]EKX48704.1 hypothetical protein GUITHDRAFT_105335 [Guillardia theta CCMP2712]|eukprot:XP_005835684.1 hypothetical protein GUITHDRAFT_105335 [Guillardia theta CCMP2712]